MEEVNQDGNGSEDAPLLEDAYAHEGSFYQATLNGRPVKDDCLVIVVER